MTTSAIKTLAKVGDVVSPVNRPIRVIGTEVYKSLGVKWYAQGLFVKEPTLGSEIKATRLFRIEAGDFVYNRLFAWKGSFALAGAEHAGCVVSAEFPAFRVDQGRILPEYLLAYFSNDAVWSVIAGRSSGTSQTSRLRFKEEDFLNCRIPLPPLSEQKRVIDLLGEAEELRRLRAQADLRTADLAPALLREAFGDEQSWGTRWTTVPVEKAGEVQLGRQRAPQYQTGQHTRPYLRVANVFEDRIDTSDVLSMDFDPADFQAYRLLYGDILLTEGQSTELVGRPAMWRDEVENCCFQNTL
jgi:type I restriction enzyme S subunit